MRMIDVSEVADLMIIPDRELSDIIIRGNEIPRILLVDRDPLTSLGITDDG
jgi:hypothetical protein